MTHKTLVLFVLFAFGANACTPEPKKEDAEPAPAAATPAEVKATPQAAGSADPAAEADKLYTQTCTVCHGPEGKGDGPGAASMDPKPRDFSDAAWQGEVTDEALEKVIIGGGMAVGKSALMPGNPGLKTQPDVLKALIKKLRGLKG